MSKETDVTLNKHGCLIKFIIKKSLGKGFIVFGNKTASPSNSKSNP